MASILDRFWDRFWERFWIDFGRFLERLGGVLGTSWGASGRLGGVLVVSWGPLWVSWRCLGAVLGRLRASCRRLGGHVAQRLLEGSSGKQKH